MVRAQWTSRDRCSTRTIFLSLALATFFAVSAEAQPARRITQVTDIEEQSVVGLPVVTYSFTGVHLEEVRVDDQLLLHIDTDSSGDIRDIVAPGHWSFRVTASAAGIHEDFASANGQNLRSSDVSDDSVGI
jgi:hypothetical protein